MMRGGEILVPKFPFSGLISAALCRNRKKGAGYDKKAKEFGGISIAQKGEI